MDTIAGTMPREKFADRVARVAQRGERSAWFGLRKIFDPRFTVPCRSLFRTGEAEGHAQAPIPPQFWPQY